MIRMISRFAVGLLCLTVLGAATAGEAQQQNGWPQWRGPTRQGCSDEKGIPNSFPTGGLKLLWKSENFSSGENNDHVQNGSPLIFAGKVYCQAIAEGRKDERLLCFDLKDGKKLWEALLCKGTTAANGTPVIDPASKRIYVTPSYAVHGTAAAPFQVKCLDAESGKEIWFTDGAKVGLEKNLLACAAPLIHEDLLVIVGNEKVVGLNKLDGKVVWTWPEKLTEREKDKRPQRDGGPAGEEYYAKLDPKAICSMEPSSSPITIQTGGRTAFLVQVRRLADCCWGASTVALDPKTGRQLWMGGMLGSYCSPVFADDTLITFGLEMSQPCYHWLYLAAYKPQWTKDKDQKDQFTMTEIWRNTKPNECGTRYRESSPVAVNGRVYWIKPDASLNCVEIASGKRLWTHKCGDEGYHLTSPVWADGKIFWMDTMKGKLIVMHDKGNTAETILSQDVCGQLGATPAITEGRLVVRDRAWGLHCYEIKPASK